MWLMRIARTPCGNKWQLYSTSAKTKCRFLKQKEGTSDDIVTLHADKERPTAFVDKADHEAKVDNVSMDGNLARY
ncbi:unnamed protein product [Dibothriocephalus latus]|uniref:Uncharacterized protein n=1 Tax=Dibothriocephalus latus TaxID=60516 RepID=A0A3P6UQ70_DIBLA|nr:unnamed protein product [Dibothriocephalus latus]